MGRQIIFGYMLKDQMLKSKAEKANAFIETVGKYNNYTLTTETHDDMDLISYKDHGTGIIFICTTLKDASRMEIQIENSVLNTIEIFTKSIQQYSEESIMHQGSYYDGSRYFAKDENGEFTKLVRRVDKYGACYEFPECNPEYVGTLKGERQANIDTVGVVFNKEDHDGEIMKWYDFENEFGLNESVHIIQFKNGDRLVKSLYIGFTGREFESIKYISNEVEIFSQIKYKFNDEIVEVYESADSAFCKIYVKDTDGTYTCYYNDNNKVVVYKTDKDLNPISYSTVGYKFKDCQEYNTEDYVFIRDLYGIPTKVLKEKEVVEE